MWLIRKVIKKSISTSIPPPPHPPPIPRSFSVYSPPPHPHPPFLAKNVEPPIVTQFSEGPTPLLNWSSYFNYFSYFLIILISFYVSLFMFKEIFCWIAWVTFRGFAVLFSFCFNSHKTNYVCNKCKKELKKSCWLKNVRLRLISRLDFYAPWS